MLPAHILKTLKRGDRVVCLGYSEKMKSGHIEDVLDTQFYIEFDDGYHAFIFKKDPTLKLEGD